MEGMVALLAREWAVVSQAPWAFALLAATMLGLAYAAARWRYTSIVAQTEAANNALKERLHLKTEQADGYRERALKYDEKVSSVVDADAANLSMRTLSFVSQIREFIERHKRFDDHLFQSTRGGPTGLDVKKMMDETTRLSSERNAEWDRRFKVDAIILRDELLSRLKDYKSSDRAAFSYEHPTNYFGFSDVANDLERMAKLVAGVTKPANITL